MNTFKRMGDVQSWITQCESSINQLALNPGDFKAVINKLDSIDTYIAVFTKTDKPNKSKKSKKNSITHKDFQGE